LKGGAGSEFIYSVPGYPALVNAAASVGGKTVSIPLNAKLENDLEAIEAHITAKTQAVFLVNPHNPSGTVIDKKLFHDFVKRVSKRTLVVVDEAYLEYADDFNGRTAVNNVREGDQVIVFRTFAKAYGLAGLSIGYAVAPADLAHYLKVRGLGDTHALNRLSIAAAESALKDQDNIRLVNKRVAEEREKWNAFLDKSGLQHTASGANFVFFDTKKPYDDVRKKLEEAGILIGRKFEPYSTWIRISIGLPEENAIVRSIIGQVVSH
jgi:histidinol-phosphate aminotransferase